METYKILDREYPVVDYVSTPQTGTVPLVDLPMMSDERWMELCQESAVKHYIAAFGHEHRRSVSAGRGGSPQERGGGGAEMSKVVLVRTDGQRSALDRDVEALIDVFQELHEVEKMTGRAGLSARVRVSFINILMSVDKAVCAKAVRV